MRRVRRATGPDAPGRTVWYVETLFAYTNELMERTQARCNYLIFANSVAGVAFFTIINALLTSRDKSHHHLLSKSAALTVCLAPSLVFLASLVIAVMAFVPRIYDHDIELNQAYIASMSQEKYRRFVLRKTDTSKLDDFLNEIHVLSRILEDRTTSVNRSAQLFIAAIGLMTVAVALTAL